ncbi:unnamed protein product [Effrenium voratum]|uniref:Uncharacterized protein n=1 Tax=Effrenium voratum TaxID=2562239 RepID=A0AA36HX23_9DINO|nr:unnamed protein product [Effrenium voratum]
MLIPMGRVDPVVQGLAEGTYRAFAELVGNSLFGVVLILNIIRQVILGVPRRRAQGFMDGILQGFSGLVVDSTLTPVRQLLLQTQIAYHDWGVFRASVVFCLCLFRIVLGPALGVLHLAASSIEGLTNLLLHEEAQFAPFEMQRSTEPLPLPPRRDTRGTPRTPAPQATPFRTMDLSQASPARTRENMQTQGSLATGRSPHLGQRSGTGSMRLEAPKMWLKRKYGSLKQMLADDDAVMDRVQLPVQYALNP